MTIDQFNRFCASLPHAETVVQWGGAHVWKIGGKVFAIGGWNDGTALAVSFKCSEIAFDVLRDHPGMRPAPYLASRGMTWLQRTSAASVRDSALKDHIARKLSPRRRSGYRKRRSTFSASKAHLNARYQRWTHNVMNKDHPPVRYGDTEGHHGADFNVAQNLYMP